MDNQENPDYELRLRAHRLCRDLLGGAWSQVGPNEISMITVTGGTSNLLYCCSLPSSIDNNCREPTQVLLRLYGEQARNSDMDAQIEIFNILSNCDLGPKLYGKFEDGRIEELLPANSLNCNQMRDHDISSIIAKKLASVHTLDISVIDKKDDWILSRLNEWTDSIMTDNNVKQHQHQHHTSKNDILNEQQLLQNDSTNDITSNAIARQLLAIDYKKEIRFLRQILAMSQSPKVFSHNDLHQGNLLLAKRSKTRPTLEEQIVFIDFEYCSYNYRAYDIANHFTEWLFEYGTEEFPHFNYAKQRFPTDEEKRNFARHYLQRLQELGNNNNKSIRNGIKVVTNNNYNSNSNNSNNLKEQKNNINNHSNHGTSNKNNYNVLSGRNQNGWTDKSFQTVQFEREVDLLLEEVQPFFMVTNFLWTVWCVKNALSSNAIKFGYWEHAKVRWDLYTGFKAEKLREAKHQALVANGNLVDISYEC